MNFKIVFCFIVINVHFVFSLLSQNWEIPNIHYTMKNGLPSNEVYDVLEDSIGYIWLTTDNGLCRFDGYEFKTYGLEKGLTDRVVFDMQLDTFGRIWMNSINGKILYYSPELDSIIDDPFINFDKNAFKGNKTSYYFDNKLNKLIVNFPTQKLKRHISFDLENRKIVYKTPDRAWISKSGYLLKVYDEFNKQLPENILMDKFGNPILRVRPLVGSNEFKTFINFIPFGKYHLLSTFKRAIILKNPFSIVIPRAIINDADVLEDSTYYISYGADYGLRKYHGLNNFIKDKAEVILDNTTISNFYSQKKLFWVSSASTGLYKIFNSDYDFKISYQKDILKTIIFNDKF